jgi:RNA polymerase sigma-70 factor (ECF subfamily)
LPDVADPAADAETVLLENERGRAVADAIAALPDRQREAILLVHYQDLSGSDAAAALGISVEALESLLARGRRALRAKLANMQETDV